MYIDVTAISQFSTCEKVQKLVNSKGFQNKLSHAKLSKYVNYTAVAELKYEVLSLLFDDFSDQITTSSTEFDAFNTFKQLHGEDLLQFATFDALYEYIIFTSYSSTWLRSDAALLVVFVSDEEEQSHSYIQDAYAFINWIQGIRSNVFVASIVNVEPADSICAMTPSALTIGRRYMDVADHFSGNIIDICAEDWSAGVADAAVQLTPYEWIDLTHIPLNSGYIYVYVDGVNNIDWYYDSTDNRVYFTAVPRENSLVEVVYNY